VTEGSDVTRRAVGPRAELVGGCMSEVLGAEASVPSNLREHARADLLAVVEGKDVVSETRPLEHSM
jgi:hypothetical protein